MPGIPTASSTKRQELKPCHELPKCAAIAVKSIAPTMNVRPVPMGAQAWYQLAASWRLRTGNRSLISENAAGVSAASPAATPIRRESRAGNECAYADASVITLQMVTPKKMSQCLFPRSASRATGMPNIAYDKAKIVPCSMPICTSLTPISIFIGATSSVIIIRSINDTMYRRASSSNDHQGVQRSKKGDCPLLRGFRLTSGMIFPWTN